MAVLRAVIQDTHQRLEAAGIPDARLEALRTFTLKLVRRHGDLSDDDIQSFLDAGFTQRHVLDVILGYSQKVMSNFTNHVAHTEVDAPFQKFAWTRQS